MVLAITLAALAAALSGPSNCRFVVPTDMHSGAPEWIGPCSAGYANGVGVLRVAQPGGSADLFYGEFKGGEPVRGMFGDAQGNMLNPTHSFSPRTHHSVDDNWTENPAGQDAKLWTLAASAASVAAKHYQDAGNMASAAFYRARANALALGPAE